MNNGFFDNVYGVVRKIPSGKVTTYGEIAQLVQENSLSLRKNITPRIVGFALHALRHTQGKPYVPCHRVVSKDGRLAPNFAWDGASEQRRRLLAEGVKFKDEMYVDIKTCLWQP